MDQYEISGLVSQMSFCREASGDITKCRLFSQAILGGSCLSLILIWSSEYFLCLRVIKFSFFFNYETIKKTTQVFNDYVYLPAKIFIFSHKSQSNILYNHLWQCFKVSINDQLKFYFSLFFFMLMYSNELETKGNKI